MATNGQGVERNQCNSMGADVDRSYEGEYPARAMDVLMSGTLCRSDQRPVYLLPDSIL